MVKAVKAVVKAAVKAVVKVAVKAGNHVLRTKSSVRIEWPRPKEANPLYRTKYGAKKVPSKNVSLKNPAAIAWRDTQEGVALFAVLLFFFHPPFSANILFFLWPLPTFVDNIHPSLDLNGSSKARLLPFASFSLLSSLFASEKNARGPTPPLLRCHGPHKTKTHHPKNNKHRVNSRDHRIYTQLRWTHHTHNPALKTANSAPHESIWEWASLDSSSPSSPKNKASPPYSWKSVHILSLKINCI